jgi:hypothetical protein
MSPNDDLTRQTIVVGASASVVEALERGLDVVHICTDALFESYSPDIWRHMEVEELQSNVYRYRLRQRGAYIQFADAPGGAAEHLGIETEGTDARWRSTQLGFGASWR